jgi:hypothetical protein
VVKLINKLIPASIDKVFLIIIVLLRILTESHYRHLRPSRKHDFDKKRLAAGWLEAGRKMQQAALRRVMRRVDARRSRLLLRKLSGGR